MSRVDVRYPFAALAAAMRVSEHQAATDLGLSGSTYQTYRHRGVSELVADRLAVRAGFAACEVWPEILDAAIGSVERECGNRLCSERFVPLRSNHVYCSVRCRINVNQRRIKRRRYAGDPDYAARKRAERREFYASCREYEVARQALYDAAKREERAAS